MIQPSAFRQSPADQPGPGRRTRCPAASYTTLGDTTAFGIGQRDEALADVPALVEHASDSPDRFACFTVLDQGLAGSVDPDRVIAEITDDLPDIGGRLLENGAVISGCHDATPSRDTSCLQHAPDGEPPATRSPMRPLPSKRLK